MLIHFLLLPCAAFVSQQQQQWRQRSRVVRPSFEGDESVEDLGDAAKIADFRAKLMAGGLDGVATTQPVDEEPPELWARQVDRLETGRVLLGSESFFFGKGNRREREGVLDRVALPLDLAKQVPEGARGQVMPAILVVQSSKVGGTYGVLLGRRSGVIMGDFKDLDTSEFLVQPLWVGGTTPPPQSNPDLTNLMTSCAVTANTFSGIMALHPYSNIPNAERLNDDGLWVGGDWDEAKNLVKRGRANPYRFRLVAQLTYWPPGDLERELKAGAWTIADVSTELILKERKERSSKPAWIDIQDAIENTSK